MKKAKAIKLAIKAYEKKLKRTGTSDMAISMCVGSGLEFLGYYEQYKKEIYQAS